MTRPQLSGCVHTYSGYESGAGYVEESACGITPPICVDIEMCFPSSYAELQATYPASQYLFKYALTRDSSDKRTRLWFSHYTDSGTITWTEIANGGGATITGNGTVYTSVINSVYDEGRFYPFGHLTSFVPNYNISNTEFRSINSDEVECMLDGQHDCQINLSYHPTNTRRLYYTLGIPYYDLSSLTEPIDIGRCLPYQSIKNWHDSECIEDIINYLYNMCKVQSFTIKANMSGFIEWSEIILAQREQYSDSDVFGSTQIGENTLLPCCPAYSFYEGDVYITRYTEEDATSQIAESGQTEFSTEHSIFDFNRDGYVDSYEVDCFWDVKVYVNQLEVEIEQVTFNSVTLTNGVSLTDTVEIRYHYLEQITNCSAYSMTVNWNTVGLPVFNSQYVQDVVEQELSITGSLTMDYQHIKEYTQYVNNQFFHIFFEQGGEVVFECLWCKWDRYRRNIRPEDLVGLVTSFTAERLQIDNQIRQANLREFEEETVEPEPTPTPTPTPTPPVDTYWPLINGFE